MCTSNKNPAEILNELLVTRGLMLAILPVQQRSQLTALGLIIPYSKMFENISRCWGVFEEEARKNSS